MSLINDVDDDNVQLDFFVKAIDLKNSKEKKLS